MQTRSTPHFSLSTIVTYVLVLACISLYATLSFAEGGGGGAIDGKGGSGPEPTALALLGVATGVGLLISRRRIQKGAISQREEQ